MGRLQYYHDTLATLGICNGNYEPLSEDLNAEICMEKYGMMVTMRPSEFSWSDWNISRIKGSDLDGKPVAVFGCGDSQGYMTASAMASRRCTRRLQLPLAEHRLHALLLALLAEELHPLDGGLKAFRWPQRQSPLNEQPLSLLQVGLPPPPVEVISWR